MGLHSNGRDALCCGAGLRTAGRQQQRSHSPEGQVAVKPPEEGDRGAEEHQALHVRRLGRQDGCGRCEAQGEGRACLQRRTAVWCGGSRGGHKPQPQANTARAHARSATGVRCARQQQQQPPEERRTGGEGGHDAQADDDAVGDVDPEDALRVVLSLVHVAAWGRRGEKRDEKKGGDEGTRRRQRAWGRASTRRRAAGRPRGVPGPAGTHSIW